MFHKKAKKSTNPEVQEAMQVRDDLLEAVGKAVAVVDRLQKDLLAEYEEAEEKLRGRTSWNSP